MSVRIIPYYFMFFEITGNLETKKNIPQMEVICFARLHRRVRPPPLSLAKRGPTQILSIICLPRNYLNICMCVCVWECGRMSEFLLCAGTKPTRVMKAVFVFFSHAGDNHSRWVCASGSVEKIRNLIAQINSAL